MRRVPVIALLMIVGSIRADQVEAPGGATVDPSGESSVAPAPAAAEAEAVECHGAPWPTDYVPTPDPVQLPSTVLELRVVPIFPETRLPPLDIEALLAEDQADAAPGDPLRVGVARQLNVEASSGQWTNAPGGGAVWTAAIVLEGAKKMRLRFRDVRLPPGAEIYVYGPADHARAHGPYTETGRHRTGAFLAGTVFGETTYVEYFSPPGPVEQLPFRIVEATHGYRSVERFDGGPRGEDLSCMQDVACFPEWEDVSLSAARIEYQEGPFVFFCSGQLLATENGDLTPYFLTSAHCVSTASQASDLELLWFYQHSTCGGGFMGNQMSFDAEVLATSGFIPPDTVVPPDWSLLMIKGVLPGGLFWSGWTTTGIATGSLAVGIHHPDASWKRYSQGHRLSGTTSWHRISFDLGLGTIVGGSSGSGIWTNGTTPETQLLYGNLCCSAGSISCSNPDPLVSYGRFSTYYSQIDDLLMAGSDDDLEPNDSCAAAAAIGAGSYPELVVKSLAEDWYQIGLAPLEDLTVSLIFTDAYGNIDAQLYDGCGGTVVRSAATTTNNETINYTNNTGATANFFLRVYLADDTRNEYSMTITGGFPDCNGNGVSDGQDIVAGTSQDCNFNDTPDECEPQSDCQPNGVLDICDIAGATSEDCNGNILPDECDIAAGTSADCQLDGTPDECELVDNDCNASGTPDDCELAGNDCNANGIPDECDPDCNGNAVPDDCDIAAGTSNDCNANGRPDECDVLTCTTNGLWDGFQPNPPFAFQTPMSEINYIADAVFWDNPLDTAYIFPFGCETGDFDDNAVQVEVDQAVSDPRDGYVKSELFRTENGTLPEQQQVYSLRFLAKIDELNNAETDWEFSLHDGSNARKVSNIRFSSTVSTATGFPGKIVVEYPAGTYIDTGVSIVVGECYDFQVDLDNVNGTVQVYIDGHAKLSPPRPPLESTAGQMDYFRIQPVLNGASTHRTTVFRIDHVDLCLVGPGVDPDQFPDCNNNGILDECDIAQGTSQDADQDGIPDECQDGTCSDGILNQGEVRIDCGGPCPPCNCTSDGQCDNGLFCDGAETCDAFGECQPGGGNPCLGGPECADTCNEAADTCNLPAGTPCTDDGNECTDNQCNGLGSCIAVNNTDPCDDGVFCNGADTCSGGSCAAHAGDPCSASEWCYESGTQCVAYGNGDFEPNGTIDLADFKAFQGCYGQLGLGACQPGNLTGSGFIEPDDYAEFEPSVTGP